MKGVFVFLKSAIWAVLAAIIAVCGLVVVSCASTDTQVEAPTQIAAAFVESLGGSKKAIASGATVKLRSNVTLSDSLVVPKDVIFDLTNGKKLILGNNAVFTVQGIVNANGGKNDTQMIISVTSGASSSAIINGSGSICLKSQGCLLRIPSRKKLVLSGDITLDGLAQDNVMALVFVFGELVIEGNAKITGNNNPNGAGGGVWMGKQGDAAVGGSLILNENASITNNHANVGGGVALSAPHCSFVMNGGSIGGNTVQRSGAGVRVAGANSSFTKTGGIISGKTGTPANLVSEGDTFGHTISVIEWDPPNTILKYRDDDIAENISVIFSGNGQIVADTSGVWHGPSALPPKR
jgi:hypothetical protein